MDGKLVKMIRRLNSITQHGLADKLKCSRALIAKIETEQTPVSLDIERKIKEVFGTGHIDKVRETMRAFEGDSDA